MSSPRSPSAPDKYNDVPAGRDDFKCIAFTACDGTGSRCPKRAVHTYNELYQGLQKYLKQWDDMPIYCNEHFQNLNKENGVLCSCTEPGCDPNDKWKCEVHDATSGEGKCYLVDKEGNPKNVYPMPIAQNKPGSSRISTMGKSPFGGSIGSPRSSKASSFSPIGSPMNPYVVQGTKISPVNAPGSRGLGEYKAGETVGEKLSKKQKVGACEEKHDEERVFFSDNYDKKDISKKGSYRIEPSYVRECNVPYINLDDDLIERLQTIDSTVSYDVAKNALKSFVTIVRSNVKNASYNFDVEEKVVTKTAKYLALYMDNTYRIELVLSWLYNYESRDLSQNYSFFGLKLRNNTSRTLSQDIDTETKTNVDKFVTDNMLTVNDVDVNKTLASYNVNGGVWYGLADAEKKSSVNTTTTTTSGDTRAKKMEGYKRAYAEMKTTLDTNFKEQIKSGELKTLYENIKNYLGQVSDLSKTNIKEKTHDQQYENTKKEFERLTGNNAPTVSVEAVETGLAPTPGNNLPKKLRAGINEGKGKSAIIQLLNNLTQEQRNDFLAKIGDKFASKPKNEKVNAIKNLRNASGNAGVKFPNDIYANTSGDKLGDDIFGALNEPNRTGSKVSTQQNVRSGIRRIPGT